MSVGQDLDTVKQKSDIPVPLDINLSKCALTIKSTCGSCIHFNRMAYPNFKQVCSQLGIIEESKPCPKYAVNPQRIKFTESQHAKNVALAIAEMPSSQLKMMASLFNQEERTRRFGFKMGMLVYFRVFGGDYISNYVKARVLWADSNHVHIQGVDGLVATLHHDSVLTPSKWKKKELQLSKANKFKDPSTKKYFKNESKHEKDLKAMIDKIVPSGLTSELKSKSSAILQSTSNKSTVRHGANEPLDKFLIVR